MAPTVTFFIKKGCTFEVLADAGILVRDAEGALLAEFDNLGNLRRFPSIAWENAWEIKASYPIGKKEGLDYALYEVQAGGSLLKLVVADQNPLVLRIAAALEYGHAEGLSQIRRLVSSVGAASKLAEPAVAAKIKSLGALKTVFLNDLIETAGFEQNLGKLTPEMVEAWRAVSKMPASIRRDFITLETVARYIAERGKSPATIAAELTTSGTYDNWLADHLVTYRKNGFVLDKTTLETQFNNHINVVENVSKNNVSGGHNKTAFYAEVYDPVTAPNKRVAVLNKTALQDGWEIIEYKTYQVYPNGPNAGQLVQPPTLNGGNSVFKTVYDPSKVSAAEVKELGYKGFKDAIDKGIVGLGKTGNGFEGTANGLTVEGFYDLNTKTIITWYIK